MPPRAESRRNADIAIVLHDLRGGGAERAMLRLLAGFVAEGLAVDLVLFQKAGVYVDDIPEAVRVIDLKAARVLSGVPRLADYLRRARPAVALSALTHVNVATILAAQMAGARRPKIFVSERNHISLRRRADRTLRSRMVYASMRWAYPIADRVIAVSEGVAADLRTLARLPDRQVVVAYNPVFDETLLQKADAPAHHPWLGDGGDPIILAAGRLQPQKDFGLLIDAFATLLAQGVAARLLLLGEGPDRAALEARAGAHGLGDDRIAMPGFIDNPLPYMKACAAFALSSRYEGFPNVLVEALACGAPIVATDCPSGPQEILDGGRWGALVPVGDAPAFALALRRAIESPPDRAPLKIAAQRFSVEAAVARYRMIFDDVDR
ncbi:MAG: glycosyltransferase [Hyphomonadaceae bacterium]|nr:glycosyltransferase [Hyphomonadaceae bacterium]